MRVSTAAVAVLSGALVLPVSVPVTATADDSPIALPAAPVQVCAPAKESREVFVSVATVDPAGTNRARITDVRLSGARGLQLADALLVPTEAPGTTGVVSDPELTGEWDWDERRPAEGSAVKAKDPDYELLVKVRRVANRGKARSVVVSYSVAGKQYRTRIPVEIILKRSNCAL